MNTSMKEIVCPSNANLVYQNPTASPPTMALTNYKAMGATCSKSLVMCANGAPAGSQPYGTTSIHPDGAYIPPPTPIFPCLRLVTERRTRL